MVAASAVGCYVKKPRPRVQRSTCDKQVILTCVITGLHQQSSSGSRQTKWCTLHRTNNHNHTMCKKEDGDEGTGSRNSNVEFNNDVEHPPEQENTVSLGTSTFSQSTNARILHATASLGTVMDKSTENRVTVPFFTE